MREEMRLEPLQFEGYGIRRIWDEETEQWWFTVVDVIEALSGSNKPRNYWYDLKRREKAKSGVELSAICRQFKLKATNNRFYDTDCASTEGLLRIIQSIPSPKVEPFKRWLARVGYQRLQEVENPELTVERLKELYRARGYADE
jgi:DNA-damage-inducible protein D